MRSFFFHLMPYQDLDLDYDKTHRSAWVTLPNSYYDPVKGHALYNRYLDELELAAELGPEASRSSCAAQWRTADEALGLGSLVNGLVQEQVVRARLAECTHAQNMGHGIGIPTLRQHGNRNDAADRSTQLTVFAHGIHDFAQQRYVIEFLARL